MRAIASTPVLLVGPPDIEVPTRKKHRVLMIVDGAFLAVVGGAQVLYLLLFAVRVLIPLLIFVVPAGSCRCGSLQIRQTLERTMP